MRRKTAREAISQFKKDIREAGGESLLLGWKIKNIKDRVLELKNVVLKKKE